MTGHATPSDMKTILEILQAETTITAAFESLLL